MRFWCTDMIRILMVILSLSLLSCDQKVNEINMNSITVRVGKSGDDFLKTNKLNTRDNVDRQPAGLNFYEYDWNLRNPGKVLVDHDPYSFTIPFALGVTGTEDAEDLENGITDFQIRAAITTQDTINHDDARREIEKLLQQLISLGWKQFIFYQYPRLSKGEAFKFFQEDDTYGLPVNYSFSLDEWMSIDVGRWYLYAGEVFLEINFRRDPKLMDPTKPGAYFLTYNLQNATERAKAEFTDNERKHWQDLWVNKIKSLKKERYAKEAELIKRGFTIYADYEEPIIHPADPVE